MHIEHILWKNMTLSESTGSSEEEGDSGEHGSGKPAVDFKELQWHVILGICLVSVGLLIVILCITWSCIRNRCSSVPKKIGRLKVIVRQPSIVSLGDDISNQRTWVTGTNISQLDESHPSIFQVLPSLHNPNAKDSTQHPKDDPPSYEDAQALKRKKLEKFLNV